MAAVSIRDLDDTVKERLRLRAAQNGRSMESEIRTILADAVGPSDEKAGFLDALMGRMAELGGGIEFDVPDRAEAPRAADLST